MHWYYWLATIAILYNVLHIAYHIVKYIQIGNYKEYATSTGNPAKGIMYSFTGAMSPFKKESAYLHWPTYIGGIFYHLGIFISIILFLLIYSGIGLPEIAQLILGGFLAISALSGILILFKRIFNKELRALSNPDDFISNILVDIFLIFTIVFFFMENMQAYYYISASLLLFYIPLGKLKHALYFFAARYHLGLFYGRRNVWPPLKSK